MRRLVVLLAVAGWAASGCYRYAEPEDGEREAGDAVVVGQVDADGTFRADTLPGEPPDTLRVERETVMTGTVRPAEAAPTATGWRVQVFADTDRATASAFARRVEGLAGGEPVYVERADPWWRVRVGDFREREAAERLRERLEAEGIEGAWTVRTTIRAGP